MIRVQLVDDHPLVVEGLVRIINDSKIACITGTASSLKECRRIIARCVPDVLLLDIGLPDGNGIDACAEILQAYPEVKILMLTGYSELNVITRSLENGALGYVLKNSTVEEIIEGICTVALGERFLCEEADILLRTKKKRDDHPLASRTRIVEADCGGAHHECHLRQDVHRVRNSQKLPQEHHGQTTGTQYRCPCKICRGDKDGIISGDEGPVGPRGKIDQMHLQFWMVDQRISPHEDRHALHLAILQQQLQQIAARGTRGADQ